MNAIAALFGLLGQTIARQEAIIEALTKKGIITIDDVNAVLPTEEQAKARVADLQREFVDMMKEMEKRETPPQQSRGVAG